MVKVKMWEIKGDNYPATKDNVDVCCPECGGDNNVMWPYSTREVDHNDDRTIFDFDKPVECSNCAFWCNAAVWFR